MKVDLKTCVPGQSVKNGDGATLIYAKHFPDEPLYKHALCDLIENEVVYFMDDGKYYKPLPKSLLNIVEILPLDKLEQPKPDKHPSVAWWESCPWITDRLPTVLDGDTFGRVCIKSNEGRVLTSNWIDVNAYENWIHIYSWQPPKQTPKEKALALIAKHKDSSTVGVWVPTPDEWDIILEGLEE
jgi:hypothetical protein